MIRAIFKLVRSPGIAFVLALALVTCDERTHPVAPASITSRFALPTGSESEYGADWGPWSEPVNLTAINSSVGDNQPTLSPDRLALYFASPRPGGLGGNDVWVSTRTLPEGSE